jgi:sulfide:quinone oxidoreductase
MIREIDPTSRRVVTDAGPFEADIMVVALGNGPVSRGHPGLVEGGHELHTVAGAFALRAVLDRFEGGRVLVHPVPVRATAGTGRPRSTEEGPYSRRLVC